MSDAIFGFVAVCAFVADCDSGIAGVSSCVVDACDTAGIHSSKRQHCWCRRRRKTDNKIAVAVLEDDGRR